MRARFLPNLVLAVALVTLAGCDSSALTESHDEANSIAVGNLASGIAGTTVALCLPDPHGRFSLVDVHSTDVQDSLARGAVVPGTGTLDEACRPASDRAECPCFSARELALPVAGSRPQPYLYFDTFNWWGLDSRRTEVRSLVQVNGVMIDEVAAVYITPNTPTENTLACHRGGVERREDHRMTYIHITRVPTVSEAEACRQIIEVFAGELHCVGPACGMPYTSDQLVPEYPLYDDGMPQPRLHVDLRRAIEEKSPLAMHP